jgi:23S rRNA A2030 N6-methylase RlmJ
VANRHFGKAADMWKHLPLAEILSIEQPTSYWESHAGSAEYAWVDDPERRYGADRLVRVAPGSALLARSRYLGHLRSMNPDPGTLSRYPGSPRIAMAELGAACSYLLCDLDPESVADITATANRLGVDSSTRAVTADGMATLHEALLASPARPGAVVAHIDPYDPRAAGPTGVSALDLARDLIDAGVGLVYWYGYDRPDRRAWALDELAQGTTRPLWGGDILVMSADGTTKAGGDLGVATTPGTGFGIVCANVSDTAVRACEDLGTALSACYEGAPLPDGTPGRLDFAAAEVRRG